MFGFYELVVSVSELGLRCSRTRSLSLSPGWRSPNTHTLETQGPILATQVILEWQLRKAKRGIFLSPSAPIQVSVLTLLLFPLPRNIQYSSDNAFGVLFIHSVIKSNHFKMTVSALFGEIQCWNVSIDKKKIAAGLYRLSAPIKGTKITSKQQRDWMSFMYCINVTFWPVLSFFWTLYSMFGTATLLTPPKLSSHLICM